jgi:hypothetical protein
MASTEIRDRRRTLRYRHLLVRQMVQMKNRISGLLLETRVSHNKQRLHKVGYFRELLASNEEVHENIRPLLRLSRETIVRCQKTEYALVSSLQRDPLLAERIKRLRTVPGVGPNYRAHLGTRDRGCITLSIDQTSDQLLWAVRRREEFRRQGPADTAFQTAQQTYPACAGGSCQVGAQTKP